MLRNIAYYSDEILKLTKERTDNFNQYIQPIDTKISELKVLVRSLCKHPSELILVSRTCEEDEYGSRRESWDKYKFKCTVCGVSKYANANWVDKNEFEFSELLELKQEELK